MKDRETKRTSPLAKITLGLVGIVVVLEVFVIFGGLELKEQTVKKYAPWAYEIFLRLVGEHSGSMPQWIAEEPTDAEEPVAKNVAGLAPEAIPQLLETNAPVSTNLLIEPTVPLETNALVSTNLLIEPTVPLETNAPASTNLLIEPTVLPETEVVPVLLPTNSPEAVKDEDLPVG